MVKDIWLDSNYVAKRGGVMGLTIAGMTWPLETYCMPVPEMIVMMCPVSTKCVTDTCDSVYVLSTIHERPWTQEMTTPPKLCYKEAKRYPEHAEFVDSNSFPEDHIEFDPRSTKA